MRVVLQLISALLLVGFIGSAAAGERGSKKEAVAMVHRVQDGFVRQGAEATFREIDDLNNKEFHDRDLYPFVYTKEGVNLVHGARPDLVGKNLLNIRDADGRYLIQDIVRITNEQGSGWVDYKWPDPLTNNIENKSSYVEKLGEYVVGVGVYLPKAE